MFTKRFLIRVSGLGITLLAVLLSLTGQGNLPPAAAREELGPLMGGSNVTGTTTDITGPAGSESFGTQVYVLPNGNIVVTDPMYDAGAVANVGAVYLYAGASKALISTLTGSTADDRVGNGGIVILANGNYVVSSYWWNNGSAAMAGAATWCSQATGCSGAVSASNSLVGSTTGDRISAKGSMGFYQTGIYALPNGNYVVSNQQWHNGSNAQAGAATWGNGATGTTGVVSAANSLIGSTADDAEYGINITLLPNSSNYVVSIPRWDNGTVVNAGAVAWGNGATGTTGVITATNSLVGSATGDEVGSAVVVLTNGNYVVSSRYWRNGAVTGAGAATWAAGTQGITGPVSAANSLVGTTLNDGVAWEVLPLSNGNYVVISSRWDNGPIADAGAATWADGTKGITGTVSASNSLVGSTANDMVGTSGNGASVAALANGNYVVTCPSWDNGSTANVGAATWGNGATGITGTLSMTNSLIGSSAGDGVGAGVQALTNGNYVVNSPAWSNGATAGVGAVTWGNGATGTTGVVSTTNSLVGSSAGDQVGLNQGNARGVTALTNGNYVVSSLNWHNGALANAGAATWGNGATGTIGVVSAANSLVGSTASDYVGDGVLALTNGNYVVTSPNWDNGAIANVGAATWGNGATGTTGVVSTTNSLVGSTANDRVGSRSYSGLPGAVALSNGNYVVQSARWANGTIIQAGALTWADGAIGITGAVSVTNSLVGSTTSDAVGGQPYVTALTNGCYVALSPAWDNSAVANAGAATLGCASGTFGPISSDNSVLGTVASGGPNFSYTYDYPNDRLVVGYPAGNSVYFLGCQAVTLTKSVSPASVKPGDPITYTITFGNSTPNTLVGVALTDTLSVNLVNASYTSSGVTLTPVGGSRYAWTMPDLAQNDGGVITITGVLTRPLAAGTIPNTVTLAYSGTIKTATANLTVQNVAPVANAGVNQSVSLSQTVTLNGSGTDENGDALTYGWTQTGGSPTVTLSNPAAQSPTFTAPVAATVLTFTLTVTDTGGLTDTDEVVITVSEGTPGYASAPTAGSTINVGQVKVGAPVTATLTISETGNATLNVTSLDLSGPNAAEVSVLPTSFSIVDGGAAQTVNIVCTPAGDGLRTATLTVNHNAAGSPATYTLNCTGKAMVYLPIVLRTIQ